MLKLLTAILIFVMSSKLIVDKDSLITCCEIIELGQLDDEGKKESNNDRTKYDNYDKHYSYCQYPELKFTVSIKKLSGTRRQNPLFNFSSEPSTPPPNLL
jgi:hypothetical protein